MGFPCQDEAGRARRSRLVQLLILDGEEQQQSDQQREDAESFSHREAEDQAAELAVGCRRVAQGARQVAAENVAEAESRAGHAETGQTCADVTCCFRFHVKLLVTFEIAVFWSAASRRWTFSLFGQCPPGCTASFRYMQVSTANTRSEER